MNVGQASAMTGLPAKTIRYYEEVGLVVPARAQNGYRVFSVEDIHKLRFMAVSRSLGFPVAACRQLLDLYQDKDRASGEVKALAGQHLTRIDEKIAGLQAMRDTLAGLVSACKGDHRPDCPIIDGLASVSPLCREAAPGGTLPGMSLPGGTLPGGTLPGKEASSIKNKRKG